MFTAEKEIHADSVAQVNMLRPQHCTAFADGGGLKRGRMPLLAWERRADVFTLEQAHSSRPAAPHSVRDPQRTIQTFGTGDVRMRESP